MSGEAVRGGGLYLREVGGAAQGMHPGRRDQQAGHAAALGDVPFGQDNGAPGVPPVLPGHLYSRQTFQALPEPDIIGPPALAAQA